MLRTLLLTCLAAAICMALPACETTQEDTPASRGVSTLPWNRPAKWEGGGPLGGQMNAMRGY